MIAHEQSFWKLFFFVIDYFNRWSFFEISRFKKTESTNDFNQFMQFHQMNESTTKSDSLDWKNFFIFKLLIWKIENFFWSIIMNRTSSCNLLNIFARLTSFFLCFSFHTTHYLQSLNVDCFESLVKAYKKQLNDRNQLRIVQITKLNFLICLRRTKIEVMTTKNIMTIWTTTDENFSIF